ncbi:glutathione ABC transporter permease GsiC [Meridianimarinicoccus roseus]|uniref:Glutathione ABC transporter permease GsiC n=1 Tax=Meridianimarinicoccus roseus TaxID=2072018 RepID=A0A2V2LA35_9RHOB|nr:ABC transporter permease [Meridianimarinicoccus roseus]PWR02092.1 glutathione ABC transporter permease GsiC [Meridianimarinicoccus roseus]
MRYLTFRLLAIVPILFGISVLTFAVVQMVPGDPIVAMIGLEATDEAIATLRARYGLDQPVVVQYFAWLGNVLQGDLGRSIQTGRPVLAMLGDAIWPTVQLAGAAIFISLLIAIPAGILSAVRRNGAWDFGASFVALAGLSVPSFWLGVMLILAFSVTWPIFPASGYVPLFEDPAGHLRTLVLPAITLGTSLAAATMRMTRSAMLEVLSQDYIRTAWAKGLSPAAVITHHAFRTALMPVVTLLGIQMGQVLGGVVITETVFSWPGIGKLTVDAIFARDYPVVQGAVLLTATAFVLINLATDLVYAVLDPRATG